MTQSSAASTEAARQFWARALSDGTPQEIGPAAARIHLQLRVGLSRWIGAEGFRALSARAISLAQAEHPKLNILLHDGDEQAITAAVRLHGAAQVTGALEAQLAAVIDLLGRIIGEEMAMQLVQQTGAVSLPGALNRKIQGGRNG